ncbi:cytochrome P450 2J2 isoform X2 [Tetranychus urticae]|uniref:Cytochrome P450 n=2 Tax=Tetranychus urticae TaxID=32264 RepID=T1KHH2_TETUR|nr:cytochrome P450 2J2 isoform X2 [Tetranychus urticae]
MRLGSKDVVVINDWHHMKEAFANNSLLARPNQLLLLPGIVQVRSIVEMSGYPWREHRRLSLRVLRDVGLGKSRVEKLIMEEIEQFCGELEKGPFDDFITKLLPSVSNNIANLLLGHCFKYNDPIKISLDNSVNQISKAFQFIGMQVFLPWLIKPLIALKKTNLNILKEYIAIMDNYVQSELEMHKANFEQGKIDDYIDGYLNELSKRSGESDIFNSDILKRNVIDFFRAGTGTVLATLSWAILYLVKYPDYQDKIRSEIHEVIGVNNKPDYSYRTRMPVTMSFIAEVSRLGSVVGSSVIRRASQDTKIGKYTIPEDTIVIFNFWSIHRDPRLWTNPDEFNPSRFLTQDGKVEKPSYLIPFSGGKRICPGEGFANVELFLYIVCMVQRYKIKTTSEEEISLEGDFSTVRRPSNMPRLMFEKIKINQ